MNYGRAIRTCRVAFGIQQRELAARSSITPSFLSLIEAEKRKPSMESVKNICAALDVPPHLLLLLAAEPDDLEDRPEREIEGLARSLLNILIQNRHASKDATP